MTTPHARDAEIWATRAPEVDETWFLHRSRLHGVSHTQRVYIHVLRLLGELGWDEADAGLALQAALWHDIGRIDDGWEPPHGERSAARADELGLTAQLAPADAAIVRFAIHRHSLPDAGAESHAERLAADPDEARRLAAPERALRILRLLKDADGLDRVRLGWGESADPRQLRHPEAVRLIPFGAALFAVVY